jgi:rod shape-determining protein MreC
MSRSFWDVIKDWVLLFALLGISLGVMLSLNQPLVRSMRATALESTAWLETQFSWVGSFLTAVRENDQLRTENIKLSSQLARLREAASENERLLRMLNMRDTTEAPLLPARVVSKDITRQNNLLTINRGRSDSVKVDMAVIDERGIVGKVALVSENYARVIPLINTNFRVPAKIRSLQAMGIVRWDASYPNQLVMEHVPRTEPVLPGQVVTTSAYSGVFPAGYPVGVVDSTSSAPGRNELQIFLNPVAPLQNVEHVFIVLQTPSSEMKQLNQRAVGPQANE